MTDPTDILLVMGLILAGSWIFLFWTLWRERRARARRVTWYQRYQQRQTRQRK